MGQLRRVGLELAFAFLASLGGLLGLGACGGAGTAPAASAGSGAADDGSPIDPRVQAASKEYLDLVVSLSPETATQLGRHSRDDDLDDRRLEAAAAEIQRQEALLASVEARFRGMNLDRPSATDVELLVRSLRADVALKKAQRPHERRPDLYASPLQALFLMRAREYAPAAERARHMVARLRHVPEVVAQGKANLKAPPRIWTQIGLEKAGAAGAFFDELAPFFKEALPPAEQPAATAALNGAREAYASFKVFLEKEVLPRSTGDFAAGKDLFGTLLHETYALEESPEDLQAMGQRALEKTKAQMTEVARRIDPKAKGFAEVLVKVKSNHPAAGDLLKAYRGEVARARAFLVAKKVVPFPPGDDLDVVDTPVFLRSTTSAAYEMPPAFDPVTKGLFFVTPVDTSLPPAEQEAMLRENDWGDIVDTVTHEAYPGHHLQLSWARRHPSLLRRISDAAIFSEGWALYSEELMAELGYYNDEQRLMQLEWTLVRAARVVIDVGLHTKGMTFDQAVRVLTDEVHLEGPLAESEVKRYTESPTQPLAYLTGREQIFALREKIRAREGAAFTLESFHRRLLTKGSIPPGLIAREM